MKKHSKKDVYQIITDLLIDRLEKGAVPWQKPWSAFGPATNYISRKPYRGINQFILNSFGHAYPFYLTFKQASGIGGRVKKGSKSIPVTYWNFVYIDKETKQKITLNEAKRLPAKQVSKSAFLKYYSVFNVADVEGVEFNFPKAVLKPENTVIENCETMVKNMPLAPGIQHNGNRAYYSPVNDCVNVPELEFFKSSGYYYSVLFHELIHSTGHGKRLARPEIMDLQGFGSHEYSKEELTAEMGASYLTGFAGIQSGQTLNNSAAYIQGWLKVLKNDKTFVIEAAGKAQKAADFILNVKKGD